MWLFIFTTLQSIFGVSCFEHLPGSRLNLRAEAQIFTAEKNGSQNKTLDYFCEYLCFTTAMLLPGHTSCVRNNTGNRMHVTVMFKCDITQCDLQQQGSVQNLAPVNEPIKWILTH